MAIKLPVERRADAAGEPSHSSRHSPPYKCQMTWKETL